jgi:hypothetical protein
MFHSVQALCGTAMYTAVCSILFRFYVEQLCTQPYVPFCLGSVWNSYVQSRVRNSCVHSRMFHSVQVLRGTAMYTAVCSILFRLCAEQLGTQPYVPFCSGSVWNRSISSKFPRKAVQNPGEELQQGGVRQLHEEAPSSGNVFLFFLFR